MAPSSIWSALSDVGTIPRLRVGKRRTGSIVPVIWQFLRDAVVGFSLRPGLTPAACRPTIEHTFDSGGRALPFEPPARVSPAPPHRSRTWGTGPDRSASDERSSR